MLADEGHSLVEADLLTFIKFLLYQGLFEVRRERHG